MQSRAPRASATKAFPQPMLKSCQFGDFCVALPFAVPYLSLQEDPPLVCARLCVRAGVIRTLYRLAAAESNTAKQRGREERTDLSRRVRR